MSAQSLARKMEQLAETAVVPHPNSGNIELNSPVVLDSTLAVTGQPTFSAQALLRGGKPPIINQTLSPLATAGAGTYTAALLLGGVIERDCAGTARTDTTDTAVAIVAAIPGATIGDSFTTSVINVSGTAVAITLAGGTGVTLKGSAATVDQNKTAYLEFILTSLTAVTCYVTISA